MRFIRVIVVVLLSAVGVSRTDAATLNLKSGFVRYEASLKTLGMGRNTVSAVNRKVIGKIVVSGSSSVEGGLVVPVVGFDSNNSKRDKDVANILKYKEHPAITFEVIDIATADINRILQSDSGQVDMRVLLTAAGGSKEYDVVVSFESVESHTIRFVTGIDAKFTDFGIEPPKLGWVLKTAMDEIYLSGDLVFELEEVE
jgi:hypothetical protein